MTNFDAVLADFYNTFEGSEALWDYSERHGIASAVRSHYAGKARWPVMTADRIAELEREIAELEQADAPAHMADAARAELDRLQRIARLELEIAEITAASKAALLGDIPADINRVRRAAEIVPELSRLRKPELNSRGEPMDHATIARGRKPTDAENAPLSNEKPKGGGPYKAQQCDDGTWMVCTDGDVVCTFDSNGTDQQQRAEHTAELLNRAEAAPSPATSPGPQDVKIDVRVKIDNIVGTAIDAALSDCDPRPISAGQYSGCIQSVTDALLSAFPALAQSDAHPEPVAFADWPVSATECAKEIMTYLGQASDPSLEPGMDRRRDNVARLIEKHWRDRQSDAQPVGLEDACKPWEFGTGEPPQYESPLTGVFCAGMAYTERLLAKALGVERYEGGDGSEDFDCDATNTLLNILAEAKIYDRDECKWAILAPTPPSLPEGAREALEAEIEKWETDERVLYPDNEVLASLDRINSALTTPTPSSAGLIEAAELLEAAGHTPERAAWFKEAAAALRARAADRSAT